LANAPGGAGDEDECRCGHGRGEQDYEQAAGRSSVTQVKDQAHGVVRV
jgi:hypothetical protein